MRKERLITLWSTLIFALLSWFVNKEDHFPHASPQSAPSSISLASFISPNMLSKNIFRYLNDLYICLHPLFENSASTQSPTVLFYHVTLNLMTTAD